jgi:hypothetical protein
VHDDGDELKAPKHIPKGKIRQHARRVELVLIDGETFQPKEVETQLQLN